MTAPEREVESRTEPATSVELLLLELNRLEQQPLEAQVDLLETVRSGLDAILAQPVHQPVHQRVHQPIHQPAHQPTDDPAPGAADRPRTSVPQPSTGPG